MKALDKKGIFASIILGIIVLLGPRTWTWFALLLIFFFISFYFTRFRYHDKYILGSAEGKGGTRSWNNVLANGGVVLVIAIIEFFIHGEIFAAAFLGAIATSTSDTLATEVGLLSKKSPRLITRLSIIVNPGLSGGVTTLGLIMALVGSSIIGLVGVVLGFINGDYIKILIISIFSGFFGATVDSLFGATIQGSYRCKVCGVQTENQLHHDEPTKLFRGFSFVGNSAVNLFSTSAGAVFATILFIIL